MARPRSVPDPVVHDAVLALIRHGGDKAVTFSAVAAKAGLAASSLAERHGSVAGMIAAARAGAWDRLEQATAAAIDGAPLSAKGATGLLKALAGVDIPPIATDPARATRWRAGLEAALTARLGNDARGREAAVILFALWQDRSLWHGHAEPTVRLKAALKRLGL
jgi:AcrR family transcriptional regulator